MFDPEKVERINSFDYLISEHCSYVEASDYDQLLGLYREAMANREAYAKGLMTMRQTMETQ